MQASAEDATCDDICFLTLGTFVIVGNVPVTDDCAVIDDGEQVRAYPLSQGPFCLHGLIPHHEVGFALMAKTLMGEHPGSFRTE